MKYRTIQYSLVCDGCGASEVVNIGMDSDNSKTMYRTIGWHRYKGKDLCPDCYEREKKGAERK